MKYLIPFLCCVFLVLFNIEGKAQHEIHKKNGDILFVKIIEVGLDEIKYEDPSDSEIIRSIDKDAIAKLVMGNGKEEDVKTGFNNEDLYADQRKKAVKFNFLSPISSYFLEFGYENSLKPGRSIELSAGFIGIGKNPRYLDISNDYEYDPSNGLRIYTDERSSKGIFLHGGYKFFNTPNYAMRGMRYSHLLKGTYVKPEVVFGTFFIDEFLAESFEGPRVSERTENIIFGAVIINLGRQWIFDDLFLLDVNAGIGYGSVSDDVGYAYGIAVTHPGELGLAGRGSVSIGVLLK